MVFEFRAAGRQLLGLGRERRVLSGQLTSGTLVGHGLLPLVVRLDHSAELAVAPGQGPGPLGIGVHGRVGQLTLEFRVLLRQLTEPIEHRHLLSLPRPVPLARLRGYAARPQTCTYMKITVP